MQRASFHRVVRCSLRHPSVGSPHTPTMKVGSSPRTPARASPEGATSPDRSGITSLESSADGARMSVDRGIVPLRSRCNRCSRGHRSRQDLPNPSDDCGWDWSAAVHCESTFHRSSSSPHPLCRSTTGASLRGVGLLQFVKTTGYGHTVDRRVTFAGAMVHIARCYEGSAIAVAG
jgi:hypothetical protein